MTQVDTTTLKPGFPALHALAENWWLILLRGLCAIAFGVLTLLWPGLSLVTLIVIYGAFAFADGILAIIAAIRGDNPAPRWWLAIVGLLGIAAGALTVLWPGITGLVLLLFIAGWAIASGTMQIIGAIRLRNEIPDELWLFGSGLLSVVFGILVLLYPGAGALGLSLAIGAFAIAYGILLISLSLRLRKHLNSPPHEA